MRPKILITNTDRSGRVTNKFFVRIGRQSKLFGKEEWEDGGVEWINEQLSRK